MKKEKLYEAIGDIKEEYINDAHMATTKKSRPVWVKWGAMAACFAVIAVLGISMMQNNSIATPNNTGDKQVSTMKPVINFEGIVTNVEDNRITMNDGKVVIITEDTVFGSDLGTANSVSKDIRIGNFIQGYTKDDVDEEEITASRIWCNEGRAAGGEKRVINFEGRVTKVGQNSVTLDNGKIIKIEADTAITSPDGSSTNITEGDYIQGYSENVENNEIEAKYILVTIF